MSSHDIDEENQAASSSRAVTADNSNCETMKRAAAKQLIERYYCQLTDGCGTSDCANENCASSNGFRHKEMTRNQAAVHAINLFTNKAVLCDSLAQSIPSKVAKSSENQHASGRRAAQRAGHSGSSETSSSVSRTADAANAGPSSSSSRAPHSISSTAHTSTTSMSEGLALLEQASSSLAAAFSEASSSFATAFSEIDSLAVSTALSELQREKPPEILRVDNKPKEVKPVPFLTESSLNEIISECETSGSWSKLIRAIGCIYNNPDSLMTSFLRSPTSSISKEDIRAMEVDMDKDTDEKDAQEEEMEAEDGDSEAKNTSSTPGPTKDTSPSKVKLKDDEVSVDIESVKRAYKVLFAIKGQPFMGALINALIYLSRTMEMDLKHHRAYERDNNYLNIFVILFEIPLLDTEEYIEQATMHICKAAGLLPVVAQAKLARVWATFSPDRLKSMVACLQQLITVKVIATTWNRSYCYNDDDGITSAARVMKILFYAGIVGGEMDSSAVIEKERQLNEAAEANLQEFLEGAVGREPKEKSEPKGDALAKALGVDPIDCRKPLVPWEDFVNEPLSEGMKMDKDYTYYKAEDTKFTFMTHSFLLTTAVKNLGMYFDNRIRMVNERRASLLQSLVHGAPTMPYLRLRIRRDHIIDDALVALEMVAMDNPQDLKKQLYVEFDGEQGIDEGGVSKEFFQLVVEEIFNPDIGMFTFNDETRNFWFNPTSFENDGQFTLIGIVLGLAIYNNIILDIHFPMVVYRKLLGKLGTFSDLLQSHPTLAASLQHLLQYEGCVEDTFMQTYAISYKDVFGTVLTHSLKDNGDAIPITNDNRQEYVDLYADFLLNKAVEKQFRAFKRGFQMVTDESPLKMLFHPEEVEMLVCGSEHYDFQALEDSAEYDGGYVESSRTIRFFWEVVHEFTDEQKCQLLQFTTGSDRVPVGGLAKLKLVIARNGPDSDRLPTAHTCFNVLLLPEYNSKDKLKERLLKAITYAKGFGML